MECTQVAAGALLPADVNGMHYLQAVVLEALRLRPPAYIVGRCAQRAVQLGAFSLPAGDFRPLGWLVWHKGYVVRRAVMAIE